MKWKKGVLMGAMRAHQTRNDIIGSCHFHVGSCVGISDEHINDPNCKPFW